MRHREMLRASALALLVALAAGTGLACATPRGATLEEKREYIRVRGKEAMQQLARSDPAAAQRLQEAEGYAFLNQVRVQIPVFGAGYGYGLLHDNRSDEDIFLRVAELGAGFGFGAKEQRVLLIFHKRAAFERFLQQGIEVGAEAEASAIIEGDTGASASGRSVVTGEAGAASVGGSVGGYSTAEKLGETDVEVFRFTKNGLVLQAGIYGAKYWKDPDLNRR